MAEQLFCLKWNEHTTTLISTFKRMLDEQSFVDVTLACEGKYIKAHRLILSSCSKYLDELLRDNHGQHPIIIFPDLKYDDVKVLIDYIYGGEVYISINRLPSLLKAAEVLRIRGLTDSTEEALDVRAARSNSSSSVTSSHNTASSNNSNSVNMLTANSMISSNLRMPGDLNHVKGRSSKGRHYSSSSPLTMPGNDLANMMGPSLQQQLALLMANTSNLDTNRPKYLKQSIDDPNQEITDPVAKRRRGANQSSYGENIKNRADQRNRISRERDAQLQQQQSYQDDDVRLADRVLSMIAATSGADHHPGPLAIAAAGDSINRLDALDERDDDINSRLSGSNSGQKFNNSRLDGTDELNNTNQLEEEDEELPEKAQRKGDPNKAIVMDGDDLMNPGVYSNNGSVNYRRWDDEEEDYDDPALLAETSYDECYPEDNQSLPEDQDESNGERDKTFVCHLCRLTFTAQSSLRRHMSRHYTDRERFECEICHNSYSRKDYLKEHKKTKHPMG